MDECSIIPDIPAVLHHRKSPISNLIHLKKFILVIVCLVAAVNARSSDSIVKPANSSLYVSLLGSAKDSLYQQFLREYESYLKRNPNDTNTSIEKCRFINDAYYDSYEDYNPNYEEADECMAELVEDFPDAPQVMIYKAKSLYGDSAIAFLDRLLISMKSHPNAWSDNQKGVIYKLLFDYYSNEDQSAKAIYYGELTLQFNDTLDISYELARHYKQTGENAKAVKLLINDVDSADGAYMLRQKGELLLELKAPEKALKAFRLAENDTSYWQETSGLAQAMLEDGLVKEARVYLVKAVERSWKKTDARRKLFKYDLQCSVGDSALASYRELVKEDFWIDPAGIYRLQLFFHAPTQSWNFTDVLRMLILIAAFFLVLAIPYLWILPIHYLGNYFRKKGMILCVSEFRWTLKHFWILSSLVIFANLLTSVIYEYDTLFAEGENIAANVSQTLANMTLFLMTGYLISVMVLLRRSDFSIFWGQMWEKRKSILTGIGMAILVKIGAVIYIKIFNIDLSTEAGMFLSIKDNIVSLNKFYSPLLGMVFVAFLVPVYEEFMFRGIFLSASEKYMKFLLANSLQSLVFALVHMEWKLIPFYFAFGFVAGHLRNKSQSLAPGISIHVTNNFLAFLMIWSGRA